MPAVKLPEDLERRLELLAKRTGQSTSAVVEAAAVIEHIHDLEDAYLAQQRHHSEGDPAQRIPLSELLSRYADDLKSAQN